MRARIAAAIALAFAAHASACIQAPPTFADPEIEEPTADAVERVVFLIGDAGESSPGTNPIVARLQREVERWSAALARDSAVAVVLLGDNVYPVGVRDARDPEHAADTLRLRSQIDVLSGANTRRYRSVGYFLAGNHDWGNLIGAAGLRRLTNQQDQLDAAREHGLSVRLMPTAGQPGPEVLDLGTTVRLVFLDTHWWLQAPSSPAKTQVLTRVEDALRTADGRHVIVAAHHPFASGGAHGGPMPIWEGLGILWLLRKTGSLVQDLNATVYRDLLEGLQGVFARVGKPLIFAGGHDHSLQVVEETEDDEPHWSLVSGAGSKVTSVAFVGGMKYADDVGGFMRITFLRDGSVLLHVQATPAEYVACDNLQTGDVAKCVQDGIEAFRNVAALRLH